MKIATAITHTPSSIPGMYPAINSALTETLPAVMEYKISGPDGGIITPVGAEQILTAAENASS